MHIRRSPRHSTGVDYSKEPAQAWERPLRLRRYQNPRVRKTASTTASSDCGPVSFRHLETLFPPSACGTYGDRGPGSRPDRPDLTYSALESSLSGTWKQIGRAGYRAVARFWTYSPSAVPSGLVTVEAIFTLSADYKKYQGVGPLQFFDTNGNSLGRPITTYGDGVRIA